MASLASPPRLGLARARPRGNVPRDPHRASRVDPTARASRTPGVLPLGASHRSCRDSSCRFARSVVFAFVSSALAIRTTRNAVAPIVFLAALIASPLRRQRDTRADVLTFSFTTVFPSLRTRSRDVSLQRHRTPLPPRRRNCRSPRRRRNRRRVASPRSVRGGPTPSARRFSTRSARVARNESAKTTRNVLQRKQSCLPPRGPRSRPAFPGARRGCARRSST